MTLSGHVTLRHSSHSYCASCISLSCLNFLLAQSAATFAMETEEKLEPIGLESPTVTTPPATSSSPPSSPNSIRNMSAATSSEPEKEETNDDMIQLEPTEEELERERLLARAEQLSDEIDQLRKQIRNKEEELYEVKQLLGITTFTELRDGMYNGMKAVGNKWKELTETETFRKIDSTIVGWRTKLEESDRYQKTKDSLNQGGKKASTAISSAATSIKENEKLKTFGTKTSEAFQNAGTAIKSKGTAIKENEKVQNFGERIRSTSIMIKDRIRGTSVDAGDEGSEPVTRETVVPDEPVKKE